MAEMGKHEDTVLTEEAMVVVELTRALYKKEIDEVFRILGRHMDKHQQRVSAEVMREFEIAGRIQNQ